MSEIKLCNGAFIATLQKGKNGKENWTYTPVLNRIGNKSTKTDPNHKEAPQLKIQYDIERSSKERFQESFKKTTIDIIKFLREIK